MEIYYDIPQTIRDEVASVFKLAMSQADLFKAVDLLNNYTNTISDEYIRDFVQFYFNVEMEIKLNGK